MNTLKTIGFIFSIIYISYFYFISKIQENKRKAFKKITIGLDISFHIFILLIYFRGCMLYNKNFLEDLINPETHFILLAITFLILQIIYFSIVNRKNNILQKTTKSVIIISHIITIVFVMEAMMYTRNPYLYLLSFTMIRYCVFIRKYCRKKRIRILHPNTESS